MGMGWIPTSCSLDASLTDGIKNCYLKLVSFLNGFL